MIANGCFLSVQNEIHCIALVPKQRLYMCFAFGEDLIGEEDGWHQGRVQNESNIGVYASRVFSVSNLNDGPVSIQKGLSIRVSLSPKWHVADWSATGRWSPEMLWNPQEATGTSPPYHNVIRTKVWKVPQMRNPDQICLAFKKEKKKSKKTHESFREKLLN